MKPARFVISGYFGCGNAGDEAVLAGLITALRSKSPRSEITVLSQNPVGTEVLHGVRSVHRMQWAAVKLALRANDALISGGGSLLQDTTSLKSLLYYILVMRAAQTHRKPVMMCAQGIGPLNRTISQKLVSAAARRCSAITVRDTASAELLQRLGVNKPTVEVTADLAFALEPAPEVALEFASAIERLVPMDDSVVVALRLWGDGTDRSQYKALVNSLLNSVQQNVVLLPMQHPTDLELAMDIYAASAANPRCSVLTQSYAPSLLISILQRASVVVAMRLHALILGVAAGVPPVALSYDPKVDALMKGIGCEGDLFSWRELNSNTVASHVNGMLCDAVSHRHRILAQQQRLKTLAIRNAEVALQLVR